MEIKQLGLVNYNFAYKQMLNYSQQSDNNFEDQIWVLEHFPVYTLGKAGKAQHLLSNILNIPVIMTNRGGQITYHGPGQLIIYPLINLSCRKIVIKDLVFIIEYSIINTLNHFNLDSHTIVKRPGVYIESKKIASIGLRVSRNIVYHGLSLNVNMDLTPFRYINPCGFDDLEMTQMSDYLVDCPNLSDVSKILVKNLIDGLQ